MARQNMHLKEKEIETKKEKSKNGQKSHKRMSLTLLMTNLSTLSDQPTHLSICQFMSGIQDLRREFRVCCQTDCLRLSCPGMHLAGSSFDCSVTDRSGKISGRQVCGDVPLTRMCLCLSSVEPFCGCLLSLSAIFNSLRLGCILVFASPLSAPVSVQSVQCVSMQSVGPLKNPRYLHNH